MTDFNAVGQQFTTYYYSVFDADRRNLATLYVRPHTPVPANPRDPSFLTSSCRRTTASEQHAVF